MIEVRHYWKLCCARLHSCTRFRSAVLQLLHSKLGSHTSDGAAYSFCINLDPEDVAACSALLGHRAG
jgi:hypothetical protein